MIWYDRVPYPSDPLSRGEWDMPAKLRSKVSDSFLKSVLARARAEQSRA